MKIISMKGLVEKAHGKICQDDNNSVSYRKKDGAMFSQRRCNPRNLEVKPYSTRELEIQSDFKATSKVAAAWTKANRVYKDNSRTIDLAASTEDYRKMRAAFDAQDDIPTFQAYVWSQVENGAVVVPDADDTEETVTLTLSVNDDSMGSITPAAGAHTYAKGTTVTLSASPESGHSLSQWSDGNKDNPRTLTLTEDMTLEAQFQVGIAGGEV